MAWKLADLQGTFSFLLSLHHSTLCPLTGWPDPGLEQKMVYLRITPLGLAGGSQDTTTLLADEGTALMPAGGPGTEQEGGQVSLEKGGAQPLGKSNTTGRVRQVNLGELPGGVSLSYGIRGEVTACQTGGRRKPVIKSLRCWHWPGPASDPARTKDRTLGVHFGPYSPKLPRPQCSTNSLH